MSFPSRQDYLCLGLPAQRPREVLDEPTAAEEKTCPPVNFLLERRALATKSTCTDFELPAAILLKERLEKVTAILQIDVSGKHEGVYGDPAGSNHCHRRPGAELDSGPAQRTPSAEGPLGGAEAGAKEDGRKPGEHVRRHGFSLVVSLWSPCDLAGFWLAV